MFCILKEKKIYPAIVLKHNSNHEEKVILLYIPNGEGYYYLVVKKLPVLLRGFTSKHHSDFFV